MSKTVKTVLAVAAVVGAVALSMVFRAELSPISMAAEHIPGLYLPLSGFHVPITNSLLATWLIMLVLIVVSFLATRNMTTVPKGFQNVIEAVIEAIYGLVEGVAGEKWAPKFFPIVASILLFVLLSNWLDILAPILSAVGIVEMHHGERVIIPLLRSPSTDLNFTVGLAVISVFMTQVFGVQALGLSYFSKFFNFKGIIGLFSRSKKQDQQELTGCMGVVMPIFTAGLDVFVGLLELISEFAKIISFSFRLFGNIFAGEVVLLVIPFLISLLLPLPFFGLEIFVGFIQAFIFAVLTLAFFTMATHGHGEAEEH